MDLKSEPVFFSDLYFSQHHKITSPEDAPVPTVFGASQRSVLMESIGNSPSFTPDHSKDRHCSRTDINDEKANSSSEANSVNEVGRCSQSIQTCLSFPPILPADLESMLFKYGLVEQQLTDGIKTIEPSSKPWNSGPVILREESNSSNSTLRVSISFGAQNQRMLLFNMT